MLVKRKNWVCIRIRIHRRVHAIDKNLFWEYNSLFWCWFVPFIFSRNCHMTTHVVTDDVMAAYARREWELRRRLMEGTLDPARVCAGLQSVIESSGWPKFPVWRTITHRGQRNAASYRDGRSSTNTKASDWADGLLDCFKVTSIDEEIDLGCVSVTDLGFKEATRFDVICDRIVACGGTLCLPEDGPVLREQYLDQPMGEWVRIAMKAIRGANHFLHVFRVEHDEYGLWLHRFYGDPDGLFDPGDRFVFRLSKRPLVA